MQSNNSTHGKHENIPFNIRDAAIGFSIQNQTEVLAQKVWQEKKEEKNVCISLKDMCLYLHIRQI